MQLSNASNPASISQSRENKLPFPKEGIRLSSLEYFIRECGGRSALKGRTTTDVNNSFQKPLTVHMKSSYCAYLKTKNETMVGEAQVFISHAWKYECCGYFKKSFSKFPRYFYMV